MLMLFSLISFCAEAQEDTASRLLQVEVKTQGRPSAVRSPTPVQSLDRNALQNAGSESVAGAVQYFSGVQVKDYGGIGGLKTVSIRSLGANHTGVSYNGMMLNDAQNGQIDLGKISVNNIGQISLYNAQPSIILQPARAFAYASVLELRTLQPAFAGSERIKTDLSFKTGSFGQVSPAATLYYKWNNHLYSSLNAEWQKADGEYNFTYKSGSVTRKGRRTNDDINAYHVAYDMRYIVNTKNAVSMDLYYYHSQRGLPGAVILYTEQGTRRQWDDNFFVQAGWKKRVSQKSELLVSGKYNYSYYNYLDTTYPVTSSSRQNIYRQNELYVSGAYSYRLFSCLQIAYASDLFADKLSGNPKDFATPTRNTLLNNLSAQFIFPKLQIDANLLSTTVGNKVEYGAKPANYQHFSPTLSLICQPLEAIPLRLRVFYKDIFRMPTFNDLYYTQVGNTRLNPEDARQYNAGATWQQNLNSLVQSVLLTADGYYNHINDMILAVPRQNISQWSMQNVGKAFVEGIDFTARLNFRPIKHWRYTLAANYTIQRAINIDKNSLEYDNEIPYTPKQVASFNLSADYRFLSLAYNALFSACRYNAVYNSSGLRMPQWNTQDLVLSYRLNREKIDYRLTLALNNLFNQQYQVVSYYPLPGRNFKIGLQISI